jgi:hypothetical protein
MMRSTVLSRPILYRMGFALLLLTFPPSLVHGDPPPEPTAAAQSPDSDAFVLVSLANRDTVSGKQLVITAYGIIFGMLILYLLFILHREKQVERAARALKKAIENKK